MWLREANDFGAGSVPVVVLANKVFFFFVIMMHI